jgi:hypothetical protein
MDFRERPGGDAREACPPTGVEGVVPRGVPSKRHCFPVAANDSDTIPSTSESSWTFTSRAFAEDSMADSKGISTSALSSFWAFFKLTS